MNILKEQKAIEAALNNYRSQLDAIPDELFDVTPPGGGWSYAEVYSHILQATLMSSIAVDRCSMGTNKPAKGGLTWKGRLVMFSGRFPPVKVKTPETIAAKIPANKITKEDAKNLIIKCRKRIEELTPVVRSSVSINRSKHPRLGMLNMGQWFKFIRIHLQHHLKQLKRIDAILAGTNCTIGAN